FFYILDYLAITAKPVFNIPRYWALTNNRVTVGCFILYEATSIRKKKTLKSMISCAFEFQI
ncbi:hypothetical protein, partial [Streptococcus acidominimus]|uniref:hypothetical protein n=1 Tax=Streptococcus acidominimus TaxID=1326 RepID=UPI001D164B48